jgi:hypothetical protein
MRAVRGLGAIKRSFADHCRPKGVIEMVVLRVLSY